MTDASGSSDSSGSGAGGFTRIIAERRIGSRVGARWTLDAVLGIGGSACVYAAHHRNGRRAAVKVMHADCALEPRTRRRFLSEGYAANRVGHPGAVVVFDDGEEPDGTVFLVMELLSGKSLLQWLEDDGPRSEFEVVQTAVGILDVLAAAHDRGIVHRDIKPSNVFCTNEGHIKVLDFGSARVHGDVHLATASGAVLGTPAFMAPELAAGRLEEVDARTDIWAVGATMFQLLTAVTVHAARTTQEALVKAATESAPSLSAVRPGTSSALATIVDRSLAFCATDRWPNARSMREALAKAFGLPPDQPAELLETLDAEGRKLPGVERRAPVPITLLALLVGIVLLLAIVAHRGRQSDAHRPSMTQRAAIDAPAPGSPSSTSAASNVAPPAATPRPEPTTQASGGLLEPRQSPYPGAVSRSSPTTAPSANMAIPSSAPPHAPGASRATAGARATSDEELLDRWK